MNRWDCDNLGGIQAAFIATSQQADGAWRKVGRTGAEILHPEIFKNIPLTKGQYQEKIEEDDAGSWVSSSISLFVNRNREELLAFEYDYRNKDLIVLVRDNNDTLRIFENMRLSREGATGQAYAEVNGASYIFKSNSIEPSRWIDATPMPGPAEPEEPIVGGQLEIKGDGVTSSFALTNTIGRRPRHLSVWRASDHREVVLDVYCPDLTTIVAEFATAPAVGEDFIVYLS